MNFFKSIKIMWLQHRVYKYTLKSNDYLSKSEAFEESIERYNFLFTKRYKYVGICSDHEKYISNIRKFTIKSKKFYNRSKIFLDKKIDAEIALSNMQYRKV